MSFSFDLVKNGGTYKSCEYLNCAVSFTNDAIYSCCGKDLEGEVFLPFGFQAPLLYGNPTYDTVFNESFFDTIYQKKLEYIGKLNSIEASCCDGCTFIKTDNWKPFPKLNFEVVTFEGDHICNASCVYCKQDHSKKSTYSVYELTKACVDFGYIDANHSNNFFTFGGGEPTLMQNFDEIMDKVGLVGNRHFYTTCIKFSEKIAQYMEIAKNGGIIVSLDAGTPETYKKIKGVDQFYKVIENFKKYYERSKYKNRVTLKYIVREDNCSEEEIDAFLQMIADNGLYNIQVMVDIDFHVKGKPSDKVRAGVYYLTLRIPLVARCRPAFQINSNKILNLNEKLRMAETFYHRLLIHKIEEKGLDIQDIIQYVREL